jgi:outer membrane protein OmpA-like peptidoglycan-associated protein
MKNIILLLLVFCCCCNLQAQTKTADLPPKPLSAKGFKKPPVIGLHFFYNDFVTPALIKASSLGDVLKNKQWNKPQNMEGGFGIDYLQGLTNKIDAVGNINACWVNYLLPGGTLYGSSNFLLDVNAGAHIKLLTDKAVFNPFLITKIGYSAYKNIGGLSLIPGAGVQVNLFEEAFLLTTIEYRTALSKSLSNQLYYSIGIATNFCKKKIKAAPVKEVEKPAPPIVIPPVVIKEEIKLPAKDLVITVVDEATGLPLQAVEVSIKSKEGIVFTTTTHEDGTATFNAIPANDYSIAGRLNKIDATTANIVKSDFGKEVNKLTAVLTHNDPRFTLVGNTIDKNAAKPVGNTEVAITNNTLGSTAITISDEVSGEFRTQLAGASDFVIIGKKAGFISNIENISTKGISRSATLYVKLQLGIEEANAGKQIVLNNIYFETGKTSLNTSSSSDLEKLLQFLKDNPATTLEIQGHTDNTGSNSLNTKLSLLRATSVVNYLLNKGINKLRLTAKGFGPTIPVAPNTDKKGRAQNRRVEMKVLE